LVDQGYFEGIAVLREPFCHEGLTAVGWQRAKTEKDRSDVRALTQMSNLTVVDLGQAFVSL